MNLSREAVFAVRQRLEAESCAFLARNPIRSDPTGRRLARRIARVHDWCGPELWAQLTGQIIEGAS